MKNGNLKIQFLDVGHGDNSIIYLYDNQSGSQKVIIIDIVDADKLLKVLTKHNVRVIDLIVISHSDADHCRGINDFLEKFMAVGMVKKICYNIDKRQPTTTMKLFLKKFLEIYHKQRITLLSGQNDTSVPKRELIGNEESKLFLIYPNTAELAEAYLSDSSNNASIVCLLQNKECNILFSGDLEKAGWKNLLERIPGLRCNILKMPHHGAFYEEEDGVGLKAILETLNPENVIISSGQNQRYKHPDKWTISLLREKQIKPYCTEFTSLCHCNMNEFEKKCHGDIEITVTDASYAIKTEMNQASLLGHAACII